jgi:hypothetical protein
MNPQLGSLQPSWPRTVAASQETDQASRRTWEAGMIIEAAEPSLLAQNWLGRAKVWKL